MQTNRTNTEGLSLRTRVAGVLASSSISDPTAIAEKLIESASDHEREAWLSQSLPKLIADVMRSDRNHALVEAELPAASGKGRRMPSRSAKVSGVRDWWAQFLASRIAVAGSWKPVGDMTADDLHVVIADRRAHAAATIAQADRFAAILELMSKHGAATVADLPRESVEQVAA